MVDSPPKKVIVDMAYTSFLGGDVYWASLEMILSNRGSCGFKL